MNASEDRPGRVIMQAKWIENLKETKAYVHFLDPLLSASCFT